MRVFIVLCAVAVAAADQLGYNYHPVDQSFTPGGIGAASNIDLPHSVVASGTSFDSSKTDPSLGDSTGSLISGGSIGTPSFGGSNADLLLADPSSDRSSSGLSSSGSISISTLGAGPSFDGLLSGGSNTGGNNVGSGIAGPHYEGGAPSNDDAAVAPQLEKEFYTFTVDEQDFAEPAAAQQVANTVKQSLRIVFIKGPENNGLESAAISLAKQAADHHTAIYILNKQADLLDLAKKLNIATSSENSNNKPDVHFVKYRTPADAINALKAIQGEYDALGGKSKNIDGGVAAVLNFASQAPIASAGDDGVQQGTSGSNGSFEQQGSLSQQVSVGPQGTDVTISGPVGGAGTNLDNTYLPAAILHLNLRQ